MADPTGHPDPDAWRVCLRTAAGTAVGAGVLIPGGLVLTCAHVVSAALRRPAGGPAPAGAVTLTFPGSGHGARVPARPVPEGWFPADADERGDLAVLAPVEPLPADVAPARLAAAAGRLAGDARAFGHPEDPWGVWARVRPVGTGGPRREWVQLEAVGPVGRRVAVGFSGAGVVAADGAVIGLVVAEDRAAEARVAWMIPMEVIAAYHPPLGPLLAPPADQPAGSEANPAVDVAWTGADIQRIGALVAALPCMSTPDQRAMVIDLLPSEIADAVPRAADRRGDAVNVLRTCARHDGGVAALTAVLRGFERGSLPMRALEEALRRAPGGSAVDGG